MLRWLLAFLLLLIAPAVAQQIWPGPNSGGGGGGTPGGSTGQLQYNSSGSFAGNVGFTIVAAANCNGTTDNATAINNAITAANTAGGGIVYLPEGACAIGSTITLLSGVSLKGAGRSATTIQALSTMSGATPMLQTSNFATLTGTNSTGGAHDFGLFDMTINGNRTNRTGTTGNAVNIYGFHYMINHVDITLAPADCFWSEWGLSGTVPVSPTDVAMEADIRDLSTHECGSIGLIYRGPHDGQLSDIHSYLNISFGAVFQDTATASATNVRVHGLHEYGGDAAGIVVDTEMFGTDIQAESNAGQEAGGGTGGDGIDVISSSTHGTLVADHVVTWNNKGSGLVLENNASIYNQGSSIVNLQSYGNTVDGVDIINSYSDPPITIAGGTINGNTGTGINSCFSSTSGGAFLAVSSLVVSGNGAGGIKNCMQNANYTGMQVFANTGNGFDTSTAANSALIYLTGNFQGDTGTDIAMGTLVAPNTIDAVVFTATGATCQSGTPGTGSNVIIVCAGSGTNASLFHTTGTLSNNGTNVTVP